MESDSDDAASDLVRIWSKLKMISHFWCTHSISEVYNSVHVCV